MRLSGKSSVCMLVGRGKKGRREGWDVDIWMDARGKSHIWSVVCACVRLCC
jgi:hypothetical protein